MHEQYMFVYSSSVRASKFFQGGNDLHLAECNLFGSFLNKGAGVAVACFFWIAQMVVRDAYSIKFEFGLSLQHSLIRRR